MRRLWLAFVLLDVAVAVACGARSELETGEPTVSRTLPEGGADALADAVGDPALDPVDDLADVADVVEEGLPVCDPDALYVYLVTEQTVLYRYDPANDSATVVGALSCPAAGGATPFSMGVDRKSHGYVLYDDGELFLVDLKTTACQPLPFAIGQQGFVTFGMGFAIDDDMMGETLYVSEISFVNPPKGLGRIDTTTLELSFVGPFSQTFGDAMELTSSDDGSLYGYMLDGSGFGGHVLRIDKSTAAVLQQTPLDVGSSASALAFAYWGGDFYIFTSPGGPTTVTRYRPSDGSVTAVATLPETVVGAGVSTCSVR